MDGTACHGLLTSSLSHHQSSDISESGRCQRCQSDCQSRGVTGTRETLLTPDTESEDDVKEDNEEGETICDDSLLAELSTINSSFSLSLDSNQIQPHQGDNSPPPQSFVSQL